MCVRAWCTRLRSGDDDAVRVFDITCVGALGDEEGREGEGGRYGDGGRDGGREGGGWGEEGEVNDQEQYSHERHVCDCVCIYMCLSVYI